MRVPVPGALFQNRLLRGLILVGAVALMSRLVSREALGAALVSLGGVSPGAMVLLLLLQVLVLGVLCFQWSLLLAARAPSGRAPWLSVVPPYLAGAFVESVTPSAKLGGGITRGILFQRRFGISSRDVALVIGLQAAVMILGAALVLVPAGIFFGGAALEILGEGARVPSLPSPHGRSLLPGGIAFFLMAALAGVILFSKRSWLQRRGQGSAFSRRRLAVATALAAAVWALYPLKVFCAAWALGVPLAFSVTLVATFTAYLAGLLPLTPGGLGSYEAVMTLVLARSGVPLDRALAVTMLSRVVSFWWPLALSSLAAAVLLVRSGGRGNGRGAPGNQGGMTLSAKDSPEVRAHRKARKQFTTKDGGMGSFFLSAVVHFERCAAGNSLAGALYHRCFYRKIIDTEIAAAGIEPGARVLQLGCGPFPMTAIALAERGYRVTAVDRCAGTVRSASSLVPSSVQMLCADGLELDYSGYDAVFVALHVQPRQEIVRRILATADRGTPVLCRNGRGVLCRSYGRVTPHTIGGAVSGWSRPLPGKKELVVLRKKGSSPKACPRACAKDIIPTTPASMQSDPSGAGLLAERPGNGQEVCCPGDPAGICRLCDLAPCQGGEITAIPDMPMLAAMGLRPGKACTILAVQPWGGPVICSIGGRQIALERTVAEDITVSSLAGRAEAPEEGQAENAPVDQKGSLVS
ncbi:flippase-like domain-containing protein [Alkalispirochaeta sphaeroplastigenens]|uniref:flippase-like domain-containing protein n=1 Tax=Alkalispirochaeta sphaeroplastigenens TaxID=1187066 RepID=UPI0011AF0DDB|nr:flippase-like domain-containing protein [Alkalispirochaeta sphaeroplastigenens]